MSGSRTSRRSRPRSRPCATRATGPVTAATFAIGALSLAGVPGLAGFFSKDLVLESVSEHGAAPALAALLVTAFLTAFYMGRVVLLAFFGKAGARTHHAHEGGGWLL